MASAQEDHFSKDTLTELYQSRIVKSRAVGLDGTRLDAFEDRLFDESALIERKVLSSSYKFTSYREKLISKGANKYPRQISIPTVRDRLTLRSICNALSDIAPDSRTLPPHNYIKEISALIIGSQEPLSFLRVDVRDFFPSLDHAYLLRALTDSGCEPFLLSLIEKAITNGTGFSGRDNKSTLGIPQGLSISNILSSIYMRRLDLNQSKYGSYHRYVDDILIIAPSHTINDRYIDLHLNLSAIALHPHPMGRSGKTEIRRISEGIDYLGYHLSPDKISVRTSSYHTMFANINKVFTSFKYKPNIKQFIFKLNIRITGCVVDGKRKGWLMFFSQTDNISQLRFLDMFVEKQCAKYNIDRSKNHVSSFVKAYHEIRYKDIDSPYIPNFNIYSLEEQYELISALTGTSIVELNSRSRETTDHDFKALVAKEVSDLEQDVLNAAS